MIKNLIFTYSDLVAINRDLQAQHREQIRQGRPQYYQPSTKLGWDLGPSASHARLPYSTDSNGFRRTCGHKVNGSLPVVAFWGDSLVHGDEVTDEESWLWKLQERFTGRARIVNGGVPGYGSDQALLRFLGRFNHLHAQINFLSYATSDLFRHVNISRPSLNRAADLPFLKPRFIQDRDGALTCLYPPITDFGNLVEVLEAPATRKFLRRYDTFFPKPILQITEAVFRKVGLDQILDLRRTHRIEAIDITWGILHRFISECRRKNVIGVPLLLPMFWGQNKTGSDFDTLVQKLEATQNQYLDARLAFGGHEIYPLDELHMPHNHYSQLSGGWIADLVGDYLESLLPKVR